MGFDCVDDESMPDAPDEVGCDSDFRPYKPTSYAHGRTCAHTHTHTRIRTHAYAHTHTHTHAHMDPRAHAHKYTHGPARTHPHIHLRVRTCAYTYAHVCTALIPSRPSSAPVPHAISCLQRVASVPPAAWAHKQNPPYSYWLYYVYANLVTLNKYRGRWTSTDPVTAHIRTPFSAHHSYPYAVANRCSLKRSLHVLFPASRGRGRQHRPPGSGTYPICPSSHTHTHTHTHTHMHHPRCLSVVGLLVGRAH